MFKLLPYVRFWCHKGELDDKEKTLVFLAIWQQEPPPKDSDYCSIKVMTTANWATNYISKNINLQRTEGRTMYAPYEWTTLRRYYNSILDSSNFNNLFYTITLG